MGTLLRILSGVLQGFGWLFFLLTLFYLATQGVKFFDQAQDFAVTRALLAGGEAIDGAALLLIRENIPTIVKGHDLTVGIFVVLLVILFRTFSHFGLKLYDKAYFMKTQENIERIREQMKGRASLSDIEKMDHALAALKAGEKLDRSKLLQIYAETKKQLDQDVRYASFVSIDIVNSTGMKQNEAPEVAEHDFMEYKNLVVKILQQHGAGKSTWTPDGAMIAFDNMDGAVEAAKAVLRALPEFNQKVKRMKMDFGVRIGVNAGEVSFPDSSPLQEVSSRVIDIAGHMQKRCEPGAIWINGDLITGLKDGAGFRNTFIAVDGHPAWEWKP